MTYKEAEKYILDIPKFAGKNTLDDTRKLLEDLQSENDESKIIHVAGTNGKGSVCAYLCSILRQSNKRVGVFTSPHLVTMRERICIDGEMISEEEFVQIFEKVKEVSKEDHHPSFFEFLYLMAMVYFAEKKPDYIILETGLGGRLDATNSVPHKDLCIITEIGFDHMQYLGDTYEKIASEKAGILKEGVPLVYFHKREETGSVISKEAKRLQIVALPVKNSTISEISTGDKTIDFSLSTGYYKYIGFTLKRTALYQVENASLAIRACEILAQNDPDITVPTIKEGLSKAYWPGRMDEIKPGVYLDGAHNEDGIAAFLETVKNTPCEGKRFLLFGVVADKQYHNMIQMIASSSLFQEISVTTLESERSADLQILEKDWQQYQIPCSFYQSADSAYEELLKNKKNEDKIYIAGSLYLIGQILSLVKENTR